MDLERGEWCGFWFAGDSSRTVKNQEYSRKADLRD